jgi:DinB superfamily
MIEVFRSALVSQFHAALAMLKSAVDQCPDEHWHGRVGTWPFSHVAYHTLFYTDFYLTKNEESYQRPSLHREEYPVFGGTKLPHDQEPISDLSIPRGVILEYIEFCRQKVNERIAAETAETLAGPPGFPWYKIPRAEFLVNNVRHIQHHTAQMSLYLRRVAGIEVRWVGRG